MILTVLLNTPLPHINYEGEIVNLKEAQKYVDNNKSAIENNKIIYENDFFTFVESNEDILDKYNIPKGIFILDYYSHIFIIPSMEFDVCHEKIIDEFNIHDIENIMKELVRNKLNNEDRNFNNDSLFITEDNIENIINGKILFPIIDNLEYEILIQEKFNENNYEVKEWTIEEMDQVISSFK